MLRALLLMTLVPFMLAACGKTETQKTQDHVDDANSKLTRLKDINLEAASTYGIVFMAKESVSTETVNDLNDTAIDALTKEKLKKVQALASEFASNADQALGLINQPNVSYTGSRSNLERARDSASRVVRKIDEKLAALAAA